MSRVTIDLSHLPAVTNAKFLPLYECQDRYLVLPGGGGSGKSVFAAQKTLYRTLTESGHRGLVVRKVAKTLRESVFALLRGTIAEWGMSDLFATNNTDMHLTCKVNGNKILFAGLDDVEKLKSIYAITWIWIEEASELDPEDFRQLDIRLRGETAWYKQIILSFNPIYKGHWIEGEFGITPYWTTARTATTVVHSTHRDNRFLDDEQRRVLESFAEIDPYYYQVYCQGEWGVLGKTIFNAQIVTVRIAQLRDRPPLKQGFFVYEYAGEKIIDASIKWVDADDGYISIYEDVKPGYPYVIGGDTAGDGSDYFTGHILDNVTGGQVAVLRHQFDEDLYTRQMYCLGRYYNDALEGIEVNFSTYPVKELTRLGYHRQYTRERIDTFTGKLDKTYGFRTDKLSRPLIIANLVQIVREHPELINDVETLEEMLTFVRNEKGRAEAQSGKNDDLIMGLAIAYHCRSQQTFAAEKPLDNDPDDDDEDYRSEDNWLV